MRISDWSSDVCSSDLAALQQPGIPLLVDLLQLIYQRPDIGTGSLIEHFSGRDEHEALQKLASQSMPGDEAKWRNELLDTIAQLDRQPLLQRSDETQALLDRRSAV